MQLTYYPETDTLYIKFKKVEISESEEISKGFVADFDFDSEGNCIGVEIDNASQRVDLKELELFNFSGEVTCLPLSPQDNKPLL